MGRAFAGEMELLPETYAWALERDLGSLPQAVVSTLELPVVAIGSGGSFVAAALLKSLHSTATGLLSAAMTPLEAREMNRSAQRFAAWFLSARGRNSDIIAAYDRISQLEPELMCLICAERNSPLAEKMAVFSNARVFEFESPAGKDGFLATNSLLATAILLMRSYSTLPTFSCDLPPTLPTLLETAVINREGAARLWASSSFIVLHSASTQIGSIVLESAFSESGLAAVLPADYRNFAHGRHHWLARFGKSTSIIAFTTEKDRVLAQKTMALVPPTIPRIFLELDENEQIAQLQCLVLALQLTAEAGASQGIDPGRPTVPEFGRKLYHLAPPKPKGWAKSTAPPIVAIERKARRSAEQLEVLGQLRGWLDARIAFLERLISSKFGSIIFDLDGTLLEDRYADFDPVILEALRRLISGNIVIGVATGRGGSARTLLRKHFPKKIWKNIIVGYYNGSEIGLLSDESYPAEEAELCDVLVPVMQQLEAAQLDVSIRKKASRYQITLRAERSGLLIRSDELWHIAQEAARAVGRDDITVTKSTHSVDILAPGMSKLEVERRIASTAGGLAVLKIGDMGEYPGNDFDLLNSWSGLSVDRVSTSRFSCWNLLPLGYRGAKGTIRYLESLELKNRCAAFRKDAFT